MKKVLIIAEAGVNHNGSIFLAKELVNQAVESGADIVKFQTFVAENLASKYASKAEYQIQQMNTDENQLDMLKKLELPFDAFAELANYCKQKKIEFLSTAFDLDSIDFLNSLGMKRWKIPSGEITNLPYLIKIAESGKPVLLSTGMSKMEEIEDTVRILKDNGAGEITVLHCTTEYPTPYENVNLKVLNTIRTKLQLPIGYSDHTKGNEVSIAAVALGATVIEKHFTLDRNMEGPDHQASIEPDELKALVHSVRNLEAAMGYGEKVPSEAEHKNMIIARKSITAKRDIEEGEIFSAENLTVKRPGNGISPMKWFDVLGQAAPRNFKEDELIEL